MKRHSINPDDLDQMSFADACKTLEVASRIGQQASGRETEDPAAHSRDFRDQLATLLNQAYGETPSHSGTAGQPQSATPPQSQS